MNAIQELWSGGRTDGINPSQLRWHQIVIPADFNTFFNNQWVITGFESDEGVARNKGRIGAKKAPNTLRKAMRNFPAHTLSQIIDSGNISCDPPYLEDAQNKLTEHLQKIYQNKGKTIVLGGGHEITYPHYKAIQNQFPEYRIGIINLDAHFDNRPVNPKVGVSSGTGFHQIAEEGTIHSLHIGIEKNSNTQALFEYARKKNMQYILLEDIWSGNTLVENTIQSFMDQVHHIYFTVCLDVFASAFAPGVSATAYNGLIPDAFFKKLFTSIISSPKLKAFDIAELNPSLDIDNRTAKLAASLIFSVFQN